MKEIQEVAAAGGRPIRVMQYGEGNFLRAFVDDMIDIADEKGVFDGSVAIVKPIEAGNLERFRRQNNLYTVSLRGFQNGAVKEENRIVTCVRKALDCCSEYEDYMALASLPTLRFIVSNTTEAGICYEESDRFDLRPPHSYPGKLTQFLHARWKAFGGDRSKGVIILPVELIEDNGKHLRECVFRQIENWGLEPDFREWVAAGCIFSSTLVDRIVTGYPREEAPAAWEKLGYRDELLDTGEPFALWVIESEIDFSSEFPLDRAGLPVIFTKDQRPYRERKVRILNGAHTSTVLAAYLAGKNIVLDCMNDPVISKFMHDAVYREIVPTVPLPRAEAEAFAASVAERFRNPFVKHQLLSISLNSVSKWKARILPSFRDNYAQNGKPPRLLTFSFAALAAFYTSARLENGVLIGTRGDETYPIRDDAGVLRFFADESTRKSAREYIADLAAKEDFWGEDLTRYADFVSMASDDLTLMREKGMTAALKSAAE